MTQNFDAPEQHGPGSSEPGTTTVTAPKKRGRPPGTKTAPKAASKTQAKTAREAIQASDAPLGAAPQPSATESALAPPPKRRGRPPKDTGTPSGSAPTAVTRQAPLVPNEAPPPTPSPLITTPTQGAPPAKQPNVPITQALPARSVLVKTTPLGARPLPKRTGPGRVKKTNAIKGIKGVSKRHTNKPHKPFKTSRRGSFLATTEPTPTVVTSSTGWQYPDTPRMPWGPEGPAYTLNFGYIKRQVRAGSWRRGYAYYKEGKIRSLDPTEQGVQAQVKGKYKESYQTTLAFGWDMVTPTCTCPLEDPWCKHAVAVALTAAEQGFWHAYFSLPRDDYPLEPNVMLTLDHYLGSYRVFLSELKKGGKISLKFLDRQSGRLIKQIEPLLMQIIELQAQGHAQFSHETLAEINLLKFLYQHNHLFSKDGWYHLPIQQAEQIMDMLSKLEEVCDTENRRVFFEPAPLSLVLSVHVANTGALQTAWHWVREDGVDVYPFDDVSLFSPSCPFGFYKNHVFPLAVLPQSMPGKWLKGSFGDIRDADGGKFIYEDLPKLKKLVPIDASEILHQLSIRVRPPQKVLHIEMMDPVMLKIRAQLEFDYDGVPVPYSKTTNESPYVMIKQKGEELVYWVKRDLAAEQAAYQELASGCLDLVQTNNFVAESDDAIDFYNVSFPALGPEWSLKLKEGQSFNVLKTSEQPLTVWAETDFDKSVEFFRMKIFCRVGERRMDIDFVREQMMQGKKYFFLHGLGYVEVPLATILQFNRTLQALEAEKLPDEDKCDVYRVETFKVGLLGELTEVGVQLEMSEKFATFWGLITAHTQMAEVPVPDNVNAELRPYQKQGYNWLHFLYTFGLNGILADDMGLGKTLQTLTLLQAAKNDHGHKPSLVVCPSTIVHNWMYEAAKFTPDLKVLNLTGEDRITAYRKIKDADLVITSYAILRRDMRALKGYPFRHVVLDESQNIKNWDSQTAKSAKQLQCNHRLALSGTPIENRLLELWSVFDFLMPKFLMDVDEFKYRYVAPIEERGNVDAERRLKKQVFPFILRRLKNDVAKDLPPKIESVKYCDLTEDQQNLYLEVLEETRDEMFASMAGRTATEGPKRSIFSALMRLRQICCHPQLLSHELSKGIAESGKFNMLKGMVQEIIAEGGRILIYSQFVEMLKLMESWLLGQNIRYETLTGETPSDKRQAKVDRFNMNANIPVFLISLKAGGTGLNLTGADYVILYDPWWNPASEDQAADRAHRIGQKKTVFVYRLVAKGTVEEKIMRLKDRKQDLVDSIISADRSVGKMLSFEDLKDILTPDF